MTEFISIRFLGCTHGNKWIVTIINTWHGEEFDHFTLLLIYSICVELLFWFFFFFAWLVLSAILVAEDTMENQIQKIFALKDFLL